LSSYREEKEDSRIVYLSVRIAIELIDEWIETAKNEGKDKGVQRQSIVYVVGQRNEEERKKEKDITVILRKRISMFSAEVRVIGA
jgi:hypothetical protein